MKRACNDKRLVYCDICFKSELELIMGRPRKMYQDDELFLCEECKQEHEEVANGLKNEEEAL